MEILREYADRVPFMHVYQNEQRMGHASNFLSAAGRARGEYIAFSDQDDIWRLDKIEKLVECIGNNWMAVCASIPFYDEKEMEEEPDLTTLSIPNLSLERALYIISGASGHTQLIHRMLLEKIPRQILYTEKYLKELGHDGLVFIVAAAYNKVLFCKNTVVYYRRHSDALTLYTPEKTEKTISNAIAYLRRTLSLYRESRPFREERLQSLLHILSLLPDEAHAKHDAMKLGNAHLHHRWFKTFFYCVKFRNRLFHRREPNPILSFLRGLYFPISCVDYSRHHCKSYQKRNL
jgi:glycosyltransferase involved in cell wall biosynthesis